LGFEGNFKGVGAISQTVEANIEIVMGCGKEILEHHYAPIKNQSYFSNANEVGHRHAFFLFSIGL